MFFRISKTLQGDNLIFLKKSENMRYCIMNFHRRFISTFITNMYVHD